MLAILTTVGSNHGWVLSASIPTWKFKRGRRAFATLLKAGQGGARQGRAAILPFLRRFLGTTTEILTVLGQPHLLGFSCTPPLV